MQRNGSSDQSLYRWSKWLSSISERDAELLKQGPEYDRFLVAMERLEQAHIAILNRTVRKEDPLRFSGLCLQQNSLLLRVFDFLEARDLVKSAQCCSRFHYLAEETARIRTRELIDVHQLRSRMQLLRAQEQLEGIATSPMYRTVPIPILLPHRRILVSQCGDSSCNGIYSCTDTNGNGFEFTKHRYTDDNGRLVGNDVRPDIERRLKCRIAKRFSGQTILWYLSKDEAPVNLEPPTRTYMFWANLMREEFAPPDLVHYPSFTSVLLQSEQSWQSLPEGRGLPLLQAPIVELLD